MDEGPDLIDRIEAAAGSDDQETSNASAGQDSCGVGRGDLANARHGGQERRPLGDLVGRESHPAHDFPSPGAPEGAELDGKGGDQPPGGLAVRGLHCTGTRHA